MSAAGRTFCHIHGQDYGKFVNGICPECNWITNNLSEEEPMNFPDRANEPPPNHMLMLGLGMGLLTIIGAAIHVFF